MADGKTGSGALPPLKTLTVAQIAAGLDSGAFTTAAITTAHLERIAKFNPSIRAVIEVTPKAVSIAEALDQELKRTGRRRGRVTHAYLPAGRGSEMIWQG